MCGSLTLTLSKIELYRIIEQNLKVLPRSSLQAIERLGKVIIIPTDLTMEQLG